MSVVGIFRCTPPVGPCPFASLRCLTSAASLHRSCAGATRASIGASRTRHAGGRRGTIRLRRRALVVDETEVFLRTATEVEAALVERVAASPVDEDVAQVPNRKLPRRRQPCLAPVCQPEMPQCHHLLPNPSCHRAHAALGRVDDAVIGCIAPAGQIQEPADIGYRAA